MAQSTSGSETLGSRRRSRRLLEDLGVGFEDDDDGANGPQHRACGHQPVLRVVLEIPLALFGTQPPTDAWSKMAPGHIGPNGPVRVTTPPPTNRSMVKWRLVRYRLVKCRLVEWRLAPSLRPTSPYCRHWSSNARRARISPVNPRPNTAPPKLEHYASGPRAILHYCSRCCASDPQAILDCCSRCCSSDPSINARAYQSRARVGSIVSRRSSRSSSSGEPPAFYWVGWASHGGWASRAAAARLMRPPLDALCCGHLSC